MERATPMTQFELVMMHEAGHAYVAQHYGVTVNYMEMDEDEDGLAALTNVEGTATWKERMIMLMAGLAGEAHALGHEEYEPNEGTLNDIAMAMDVLKTVHPNPTADEANVALEMAFYDALLLLRQA